MINRFFFTTHLHTSWLPLLRCGTGMLLLLTSLQLWPDFNILYGAESVVDHRLLRLGEDDPPWMTFIKTMDQSHLVAYMTCCVLLTVGYAARLWAVVLSILHHTLYMVLPAFSYGFDYLAASAIFYCCWFPVGNPASRWATPCLRVLQLHLCIIYFFGGLDKVIGPTWRNGEALWKAVHLPDLTGAWRPDISFLGHYPIIVELLGWSVILLELAYPLCVWLRRIRPVWLWGIIGVHVGIAIFMGLYHFSAIMILLNVCAFYLPYQKTERISEQIVNQYQHLASLFYRRTDPPAEACKAATKPNAQDA